METKNQTKSNWALRQMLGFQHHKHSGKRVHYSQTSFLMLVILLVLAGWVVRPVYPLLSDTLTSSGLVHISGLVPGAPPTSAPTITYPTSGTTVTVPLITLRGSCDPGLIVKVFVNNNFAGSTLCSGSGSFAIAISLTPGANTIITYQYDSLDQSGPPSRPVVVYYVPPGGTVTFRLTTDFSFRNLEAGRAFSWQQLISGGVPPYRLIINWGDGQTSNYTIAASGPYQLTHTYLKPGSYNLSMRAEDAAGHISLLNVVAVVNGSPGVTHLAAPTEAAGVPPFSFYDLVITGLYKAALLLVLAVWAYETIEKRRRQRQFGLAPPS